MKKTLIFICASLVVCFILFAIYLIIFASVRIENVNADCLDTKIINESCKKQMAVDVLIGAKFQSISFMKKKYEVRIAGVTKNKRYRKISIEQFNITNNNMVIYHDDEQKIGSDFDLDFEEKYYASYILVSKKVFMPVSVFSKPKINVTVSLHHKSGKIISKDVVIPLATSFCAWFLPME